MTVTLCIQLNVKNDLITQWVNGWVIRDTDRSHKIINTQCECEGILIVRCNERKKEWNEGEGTLIEWLIHIYI